MMKKILKKVEKYPIFYGILAIIVMIILFKLVEVVETLL